MNFVLDNAMAVDDPTFHSQVGEQDFPVLNAPGLLHDAGGDCGQLSIADPSPEFGLEPEVATNAQLPAKRPAGRPRLVPPCSE
jgi:hypothetical protein